MNTVAIQVNGEISTGTIVNGEAEIGATATIELHDENGMPIQQTGVIVEVF